MYGVALLEMSFVTTDSRSA